MHPNFFGLLKKIAAREGIKITTVNFYVHEEQRRHMGVIHYVSIGSTEANNRKMVMKFAWNTAIVREQFLLHAIFKNECHFYQNVWPLFQDLQNETLGRVVIDVAPVCFEVDSDEFQEQLVFENLNEKGYVNSMSFTKEHYKILFEQYGKFHALSFAFKKLYPEVFDEAAEQFSNYFQNINTMPKEMAMVDDVLTKCKAAMIEAGEVALVHNNLKFFHGPIMVQNYIKSSIYSGQYGVILHGDCRRDNMMFKYNEEGTIEDMKFVDFQFARLGTPVFDLSYCLYAYGGCEEEVFYDLEYLLRIYYKSLSETLGLFNCDADEIYPFDTLIEEWRSYCGFGYVSGLLTFGGRWTDVNEQDVAMTARFMGNQLSPQDVAKRMVSLTRHMKMNNFL